MCIRKIKTAPRSAVAKTADPQAWRARFAGQDTRAISDADSLMVTQRTCSRGEARFVQLLATRNKSGAVQTHVLVKSKRKMERERERDYTMAMSAHCTQSCGVSSQSHRNEISVWLLRKPAGSLTWSVRRWPGPLCVLHCPALPFAEQRPLSFPAQLNHPVDLSHLTIPH